MKNKLLILNIASYIILYHFVFEIFIHLYVKRDLGVTPLGFLLFKFDRLKYDYLFLLVILISFIINMSVSGILLNYFYKWKNKKPTEELFGMIFLIFIIVSILLLFLLFVVMYLFKSSGASIFIFFYFPMPIMVVLMVPLFKFNQWIIERLSK